MNMTFNNKPFRQSIRGLATIVLLLNAFINQGQTYNTLKSWVAQKPFTNEIDMVSAGLPAQDVIQSTEFIDGFGRTVQTVSKQTSPLLQDAVAMHVYDSWGRETKKYMAFISGNDGAFKNNALTLQTAFNQTMYPGESNFYSQIDLENSPKNRVLKAYDQGSSWVGSNRGTTVRNVTNTATDNVRIWNIAAAPGSLPASSGAYVAGRLYKTIGTDVNGNQTIKYADKDGHIILKKVQYTTATTDNGTGSSHAGWQCTYYVYDDFDNLRYIISPKLVGLIDGAWTISATDADELCYRFEYDDFGRVIIRHNPGTQSGTAGETWTIYDQRGRAVMTQDGNLRTSMQWQYFQYDVLDRPVAMGLMTDPTNYNNRVYHQNLAATSTAYPNPASYTTELLSQTWYDNYNWVAGSGSGLSAAIDGSNTSNTNLFYAASNTVSPYPQAVVQTAMVRGLPTGSKTEVMGSNGSQYLYAVNFYDDQGRNVQTQGTNVANGTDIVTTQYSWNGKPLRVYRQHNKPGAGSQSHNQLTKMTYDHASRLLNVVQNISSTIGGASVLSNDKTIASYTYSEIGLVKSKTIGPSLETQNFDYNVKGLLTGLNKNFTIAGNTGSWFGLELGYDKPATATGTTSFLNPAYNGNISGQIWRSKGDGVARKYDYQYDRANQLTTANFVQNTSGAAWDKNYIDFTVSNRTYDLNGNLKSMSQQGFVLGGQPGIDNLTYQYLNGDNSNRLQYVADNANNPNSKLGDFHYAAVTKTTATVDYGYDANGNMASDVNKGITSFTYNTLNMPKVVTFAKGTITYVYDAAGNKLKKIVQENNASVKLGSNTFTSDITTITSYMGGFVYQSKSYSSASLSSLNQTEALLYAGHEEGRARLKAAGTGYQWVFDYFIRDHLGNIRLTLSDEAQTDYYPAATLEAGGIATEQSVYNIVNDASHLVTMSGLSWYGAVSGNSYANNSNSGLTAPPDPTVNPTQASTRMYKLNGATGDRFGMGVALKVMAGDAVQVYGRSIWHNPGGTVNNSSYLVSGVINAFINAFAGTSAAIDGSKGTATGPVLNANLPTTNNLAPFLNSSAVPTGTPRANISWILFDEQFKPVQSGSGFDPISTTADQFKPHSLNVNVVQSGYLYVYCSNESDWDVYFDNLQVAHTRGPLLNEMHYYPDGLTMYALSSRAFNRLPAGFGYQGKEMQSGEYYDGAGLELYDFEARYYDVQLARWHSQDPVINFSTPYAGMHNNPVAHIDPDGRNPIVIAIIAGAIIGGYSGYRIAEAKGATGWSMVGYIVGGAAIGAFSGYAGASVSAAGGFMSSTAGIMVSSTYNSIGMTMLSGGMVTPSISVGAASFDFGTGEFGYLGKKGNSFLANLGYTFGALANISDIVAWTKGTSIDVKARKALAGHSETSGKVVTGTDASGNPITQDITISVGPDPNTPGIDNTPDGVKWEMQFVKRSLQGNPAPGENQSYIDPGDPQVVTRLNNVNGSLLLKMTNRLNAGRNLLDTGPLKYGLLYGCVNYNARALLFAGVLNFNAFLPVTFPLLLNAELALRQVGILASPFLINQ
jgi:RHS repeat-associated protein